MARAKMDTYKRKAAQAINHMAAAILAVNEVYQVFLPQHPDMAEGLKTIMMGLAAVREHLIKFIWDAWELDEDTIKTYIG